MKSYFAALLGLVGIAALILTGAGATIAQPQAIGRAEGDTVSLKRGQQYLLHASQDTVLGLVDGLDAHTQLVCHVSRRLRVNREPPKRFPAPLF